MYCHRCGAPIREGVKFCTQCGMPVPSASSGYQSVLRPPPMADAERPSALPPEFFPPAPGVPPVAGIVRPERSIPMAVFLTIITCGVYGVIWLYKMGCDLRAASATDEPHPGVDALLTVATCGIWGVYVAYKYPSLINQIKRRFRLPESDVPIISLLLALFSYGFPPLALVALALVQNELNTLERMLRNHRF